jgi:hypothetical protein
MVKCNIDYLDSLDSSRKVALICDFFRYTLFNTSYMMHVM